MMHLAEDYRKKKSGSGDDDEDKDKDEKALELNGENPLAEKEAIEEDDSGGD